MKEKTMQTSWVSKHLYICLQLMAFCNFSHFISSIVILNHRRREIKFYK